MKFSSLESLIQPAWFLKFRWKICKLSLDRYTYGTLNLISWIHSICIWLVSNKILIVIRHVILIDAIVLLIATRHHESYSECNVFNILYTFLLIIHIIVCDIQCLCIYEIISDKFYCESKKDAIQLISTFRGVSDLLKILFLIGYLSFFEDNEVVNFHVMVWINILMIVINGYPLIFTCCLIAIVMTIILFLLTVITIIFSLIKWLMGYPCEDYDNDDDDITARNKRIDKILAAFSLRYYRNSNNKKEVCSICLNGLSKRSVIILDCSEHHKFHTRCIKKWLYEINKCPMCRSEILPHKIYNLY